MTNCISGCQGTGGIMKINLTEARSAMPSPLPAGDDGLWLNSGGLTWEPVMSTGMRARMATMQMMRKKHRNPTMDQRTMWRTECTSTVDRYEGEGGDDADKEEQASQANDGSTQNLEDWGHSTGECEDWTVYFRHVKYDNGEANATARDVSEAKTVL